MSILQIFYNFIQILYSNLTMNFYLKGYYGYKNLGDEFLLLWLLLWLAETAQGGVNHLVIETKNIERLTQRLTKNIMYLPIPLGSITITWANNSYKKDPNYIKIFGGGEVVSDARPFPYNGRNYLFTFTQTIFYQRYWILGGVGTEKKLGTKWLYRQFLKHAERIVVRENSSFIVAEKYSHKVELYHDFCFDLLNKIYRLWDNQTTMNGEKKDGSKTLLDTLPKKILINTNKYIRNNTTKDRITNLYRQFPTAEYWFVPAEIWSDSVLFPQIQALIPTIQFYNRTTHSVEETCQFIQTITYWLAARLHVLLLLSYFNISFSALVYQEKITKMLNG